MKKESPRPLNIYEVTWRFKGEKRTQLSEGCGSDEQECRKVFLKHYPKLEVVKIAFSHKHGSHRPGHTPEPHRPHPLNLPKPTKGAPVAPAPEVEIEMEFI